MSINKRKASELYADVIVIDDSSDTKIPKIVEDDSSVVYLGTKHANNSASSNSTSNSSSASNGTSSDEKMTNSRIDFDVSLLKSNNIVNSPDNDQMIERAMNYCGIGVEDNSENNRATTEISGFMLSTSSSSSSSSSTSSSSSSTSSSSSSISIIDPKDVVITDEDVLNAIDDIVSVINEEEQLNAAFEADEELLLSEEEEMRVYNSIVDDNSPPTFGITPPQPQPETETHIEDKPITTLGKFTGHVDLPLWTDMYMKSC